MSTRALYTFYDDAENCFHVYKHHDGYPSGAVKWIEAAFKFAWELPRFEAADFAAAFIAANKTGGGGVYLSTGKHGDLSYSYHIRQSDDKKTLTVKAFCEDTQKQIFEGTLEAFKNFAE